MKFNGEIKFPDLDHPGVPVQALIDDAHVELVVENESLGRWSLYDVEASRLVASAFVLKLDGEEVTFVAADPIDFAYRGVEHMAARWAQIKAKRLPARSMAIRMSRKDTVPSRLEDLREAMEANLEAESRPRGIAGETAAAAAQTEVAPEPAETVDTADQSLDWDDRSAAAAIPVVGEPEEDPLAEQRRELEEERARLEAEVKAAEEREAVRLEAYRLEMERLEKEREEARRQAELAAARAAELAAPPPAEPEAVEPEPVVLEPEPEPDPEPIAEVPDPVLEPVAEEPQPDPEPFVEEPEPVVEPVAEEPAVVDLKDFEAEPDPAETPIGAATEPVLAGQPKDKAGLMGAVRSAFARGGGRSHEHNFLEAPGGLGITRYVCEDCGYVSISA